jgi:hypothetical protein
LCFKVRQTNLYSENETMPDGFELTYITKIEIKIDPQDRITACKRIPTLAEQAEAVVERIAATIADWRNSGGERRPPWAPSWPLITPPDHQPGSTCRNSIRR